MQSFQVISTVGSEISFANAQPAIGPVEIKRLQQREEKRIRELKEDQKNMGKGVTKEAQAIFDSFNRMYACVP